VFYLQAILFVLFYCLVTALLISLNLFNGMGDENYGCFELYFPLWCMFYAPLVFVALLGIWAVRRLTVISWVLSFCYLAIVLVTLEVSFVRDAGLRWLLLTAAQAMHPFASLRI
jgi:hypothetical protein